MTQKRPRVSPKEYEFLKEKRAGFKVPGQKRVLAFGCAHVPFQDRDKMYSMKKLASDAGIDEVVILGDYLDANALGDYEKGKVSRTGITLEEEYLEGAKELREIEQATPNALSRVFMFGNHEARYFRWKSDVNNYKFGDIMNPARALGLENYLVLSDYMNDAYTVGDVDLFHGHNFSIHVSKKVLDTFRGRNAIFAHTHREQYYKEGDLYALNIGMMGNINAPCFNYASREMRIRWSNAFAIIDVDQNQVAHPQLFSFRNGSIFYGGRRY